MTPAPLPCLSLGDELTGEARDAVGLNHARTWHRCLDSEQPLGPFVCPCKGCGPDCPSYHPDLESLE